MNPTTRQYLADLHSDDGDVRYRALEALLAATNEPVDWAYAAWDDLVQLMRSPNTHQRAIATTLLCNLAKSDPEKRILTDLDALILVTHDKMFITARHTIQALWKIGAAGPAQRHAVLAKINTRFADAVNDKNTTLIRYDLQVGLGQLYDATHDPAVRAQALALIDTETDEKYKKKYLTVWKKRP
jgi:HEAT repeat protein